ncbi:MAG TPA: carbohydrate ABC transporter permease [Thermoclostridium sp.]
MRLRQVCINFIKWIFIGIILIFTVYPILYTLLGSFKTNWELTSGGNFFPKKWMFSNYTQAYIQSNFLKYSINSILISGTSMFIALLTSSMAGYVFARHTFPGKKIIVSAYLAMMFISLGAVSIYPVYILFHKIGLTKSFLGLAIALTGSQATNVFLTVGFVRSIPVSMDEAAYLEGCSYMKIFYKIIIPLIRPILGVIALFAFRYAWNDYLIGLIMTISNPDLMPITVAVVQLKYSMNAAAEWHIMLAGASLAIVPILVLYIFTNKQFISGLTVGAVKG